MARALGRSPSTIMRELERNTLAALPYGSHTAQRNSASRRVAARPAGKLDFDGVGWGVVRTLLDWKWSPQQIAATLKRVFPDEPERHVSHETIYTAIYAQPRGSCASSSWPACATVAAPACPDLGARTGVGRFPTWSASMCGHLRWMIA